VKLPNWVFPGSAVFLFAACAALQTPPERLHSIATRAGFSPIGLADSRLRAYVKRGSADQGGGPVTIYIESDGAPWRFADEPPADPTPLKAMVARMAATDPSARVAYLGRPCQYLDPEQLTTCDPALWMRARFSETAVAATDRAVSDIKKAVGASRVSLVGYSGGGAMAALVTERRSDVGCLVTISAPLDTDAWTDAIGVSRLDYSLNPADNAQALVSVPQTHFQGGDDGLVPSRSLAKFFAKLPGAQVITKTGFDHACCWEDAWPQLRSASCLGP
jgi:hypothetical protein